MAEHEKRPPSPEETNLFPAHHFPRTPHEENEDEWPDVSAFQSFPRGTPSYGAIPFSKRDPQFYWEDTEE